MKKQTKMQEKLTMFFEEKDLVCKVYGYEIEGTNHYMQTDIVIDFIINSLDLVNQKKIYDKIVYLDFKNADFHDFLKYIGKGIIEIAA